MEPFVLGEISMSDPTIGQRLTQAEQLLASGQRYNAYLIVKQITAFDPTNAHAWYILAQATDNAQEAAMAREREAQTKSNYNQRINSLPPQFQYQSSAQPPKKNWKKRAKWIAIGSVVVICSCLAFFSNLGKQYQTEQTATAVELARAESITSTSIKQATTRSVQATATVRIAQGQTTTARIAVTQTYQANIQETKTADYQAMLDATQAALPTPTPTEIPPTPTSTEIPPTPTPVPTQTAEQILTPALEKKLGDGNRGLLKIQSVGLVDGQIQIDWTIDDSLTEGFIKDGAKIDLVDILEVVRNSGIEYNSVRARGSFPMTDAFGNTEEKYVVVAVYYQATINKINFDGFDSDNIYLIADDVAIVPAFRDW